MMKIINKHTLRLVENMIRCNAALKYIVRNQLGLKLEKTNYFIYCKIKDFIQATKWTP